MSIDLLLRNPWQTHVESGARLVGDTGERMRSLVQTVRHVGNRPTEGATLDLEQLLADAEAAHAAHSKKDVPLAAAAPSDQPQVEFF